MNEACVPVVVPFDAAETRHRLDAMLDLPPGPSQTPGTRASLACHGDQLRRLVVREAQRGQVAVLLGEFRSRSITAASLPATRRSASRMMIKSAVARDIAARLLRKVDDRSGLGATSPKRVDVCHYVMTELPFIDRGLVEIDVVQMGGHLVDLFLRDFQAQILLGFGPLQPESSPGAELLLRAEELPPSPGGSFASTSGLV
jgi:hypothetical protein